MHLFAFTMNPLGKTSHIVRSKLKCTRSQYHGHYLRQYLTVLDLKINFLW